MKNDFLEGAEFLTKEEIEANKDLIEMIDRMRKVQNDVLNEYFALSAVIKLNYLEHVRMHTQEMNSTEDLKNWLEKEFERMKSVGRKFTHIERIEYRMARKIYEDVVEKKGELFKLEGSDLIFNIDGQQVKVPALFAEE